MFPHVLHPLRQDSGLAGGHYHPRDIRMLARGCQQVAAEILRKNNDPTVNREIAELVSEAYATILKEVQ